METLKVSVFSFIIVHLVNKGILLLFITTGVQLKREVGGRLPCPFSKTGKSALIWGKRFYLK